LNILNFDSALDDFSYAAFIDMEAFLERLKTEKGRNIGLRNSQANLI